MFYKPLTNCFSSYFNCNELDLFIGHVITLTILLFMLCSDWHSGIKINFKHHSVNSYKNTNSLGIQTKNILQMDLDVTYLLEETEETNTPLLPMPPSSILIPSCSQDFSIWICLISPGQGLCSPGNPKTLNFIFIIEKVKKYYYIKYIITL